MAHFHCVRIQPSCQGQFTNTYDLSASIRLIRVHPRPIRPTRVYPRSRDWQGAVHQHLRFIRVHPPDPRPSAFYLPNPRPRNWQGDHCHS